MGLRRQREMTTLQAGRMPSSAAGPLCRLARPGALHPWGTPSKAAPV